MNKLSKRIALGLVMALTTALMAGCGAEDKMGYVDVNKVKVETVKGQTIKEKLNNKQMTISQHMEEVQKKAEAGQISNEEFQKELIQAQKEMQLYGLAMTKEFENSMEATVSQVAKDKKLTIVLDKDAVAAGGEDITQAVIDTMNKDKAKSESTSEEKSDKRKDKK